MAPQIPQIGEQLASRMVRQKQPVCLNVQKGFIPREGDVQYELVGNQPSWLMLDATTGVLTGLSPAVQRKQQFLVTLRAFNPQGEAIQRFFIDVVSEEFFESYHRCLLELTLRKQIYFPFDHHSLSHDLLEYIFEYFNQSDALDFFDLLHEKAEDLGLEVKEKADYADFKKVVNELNPDVDMEQQLRENYGKLDPLIFAELSNKDFRNLFRQGGQPQGAIPIAIWNYLSAPDQHVWSAMHNVLDSAAEQVYELKTENKEAYVHSLTPKANPPGR